MSAHHSDIIGKIVIYFAKSKITPLIIAVSLVVGVFAVINLPREEEPQISVPMFDIFVKFPGADSKEVEQRIATPGEPSSGRSPASSTSTPRSNPKARSSLSGSRSAKTPKRA